MGFVQLLAVNLCEVSFKMYQQISKSYLSQSTGPEVIMLSITDQILNIICSDFMTRETIGICELDLVITKIK